MHPKSCPVPMHCLGDAEAYAGDQILHPARPRSLGRTALSRWRGRGRTRAHRFLCSATAIRGQAMEGRADVIPAASNAASSPAPLQP